MKKTSLLDDHSTKRRNFPSCSVSGQISVINEDKCSSCLVKSLRAEFLIPRGFFNSCGILEKFLTKRNFHLLTDGRGWKEVNKDEVVDKTASSRGTNAQSCEDHLAEEQR